MNKFILLTLLVLSFSAVADDVHGTFTPPTTKVDGSELLGSDIAGFNIYVDGVVIDSMGGAAPYTLPPNATSFTFSTTPGSHVLTMTTIDTDGRESTMSNEITIVAVSPPNAPVLDSAVVVIININR